MKPKSDFRQVTSAKGTMTNLLDSNGDRRLDLMPARQAAAALGIAEGDFRQLLAMGWRPYDALSCSNDELLPPAAMAAELGITARHLRSLEARGLPAIGTGRGKRHPADLVIAWYAIWQARAAELRGFAGGAEQMDPVAAQEEYDAALALLRAWNTLRLRPDEVGELDAAAAARLEEARDLIRRGQRPPLSDR
jgi:hypothetical protein